MTGARRRPPTSLVALFAVYLGLLGWIVLWKLEVPWVGVAAQRVVKLVPFVSTADAGASPPAEVAVNAVLFVPFGVYLGLLAPPWRWWRVAGVVAAVSLGLETAQYVLAVGSADVTDVLVNTAGALAGLGLLRLARRALGARTVAVATSVCAIGTALLVLASGIVVASPLRHGPPGGENGLHHRLPSPRMERTVVPDLEVVGP